MTKGPAQSCKREFDSTASALAASSAAVTAIEAQVSTAERDLADEQGRVERVAAAESLSREIAIIELKIEPWASLTRELAELLEKHERLRFDCGAIGKYLRNCAGESEVALGVALPDLRNAVEAIREGREPIPRPAPAPEPIAVAVPPQTKTVFLLRHCKWTDADSATKKLGQRYTAADLPPVTAARAIKIGAAISTSDPRCRELNGTWTHRPRADECEDLDPPKPGGEPVLKSPSPFEFEVVDRGKPFALKIPREVAST